MRAYMRTALCLLLTTLAHPVLAEDFDRWLERQDRYATERRLTDLERRPQTAVTPTQDITDQTLERRRTNDRLDNLERCARGSLLCDRGL